VLRLLAAGAAASVAACSQPDDTIHPLANQPEGILPGEIHRYATALSLAGYGRGVTGLVVDGRPVKLEGLTAHPASLGATDLFTEVSLLDLYDPQRQRAPAGPAGPASWDVAARAVHDRVAPRRGDGVVLLSGRVTSPTLLARLAALRTVLPGARHVRWEPFDDDAPLAAAHAAFGRPLTCRPRFADADVVVLLDADPLGPGPDQVAFARAWADRRRQGAMPRTYAIEASPSASGQLADRRIAAGPRDLAAACHALAAHLGAGGPAPTLSPILAAWVADAARDLTAARGRVLVLAGERQPQAVHGFAAWLNGHLGGAVDWITPVDPDTTPHRQALAGLAADMHAGRVDTLVVLDANPVYAAPPALDFAEAMRRVPLTLAASRLPDETGAAAAWQLPLSHPLEGWHDWRSTDGTASIAQPLVRPFYDTHTPAEVVDLLADPAASPRSLQQLRATWASLGEDGWQAAVASAMPPRTPLAVERVGAAPLVLPAIPGAGLTIDLRPSPTLYDGRFAANAWAQECPDPLTKEVWGSGLRLHPDDMAALGVRDGDLVQVAQGGGVSASVRSTAAQARGVATLLAGYGRIHAGPVADGIGGNGFALASGGAAQLTATGKRHPLLSTQHDFAIEGELAKLFPVLRPGEAMPRVPDRPSLLPNPPTRSAPPQWAMAIDTDVCIGCNACVVACQAENNVPAIGPAEIAVGRDMHWLRVDRYENENGGHDHGGGFQPVPCMQCEKAPCEPVCPVEASIHDTQGLNVQVYNRCIGTRTCQANCPYKVRRFNFRDYAEDSLWGDLDAGPVQAQKNPDVTVRARGVMEKCTYCVQRIERASREADAGGTPAEVVTACAAACPTRAITFGPLGSPPIDTARRDPRHYALLEELGTRPRTTYLARRVTP
jgi:molybdopterin-containing oxidoreductase family iron-sulfur binding subunit